MKYRLIDRRVGGWPLFQELLAALRLVADRHGSDLATVATQAVLDRPGVAAAIVGATASPTSERTHASERSGSTRRTLRP